jgi:hypothetical protein
LLSPILQNILVQCGKKHYIIAVWVDKTNLHVPTLPTNVIINHNATNIEFFFEGKESSQDSQIDLQQIDDNSHVKKLVIKSYDCDFWQQDSASAKDINVPILFTVNELSDGKQSKAAFAKTIPPTTLLLAILQSALSALFPNVIIQQPSSPNEMELL